jgi:hypothetical protein
MFLRNCIKKVLGLEEADTVADLTGRIRTFASKLDECRMQLQEAEIGRDGWKGQANVDATENLFLANKLKEVRKALGKDDECFSRFSRDQIKDMSLEEFRHVEKEIDQDVNDGKRFLQ